MILPNKQLHCMMFATKYKFMVDGLLNSGCLLLIIFLQFSLYLFCLEMVLIWGACFFNNGWFCVNARTSVPNLSCWIEMKSIVSTPSISWTAKKLVFLSAFLAFQQLFHPTHDSDDSLIAGKPIILPTWLLVENCCWQYIILLNFRIVFINFVDDYVACLVFLC